MAHAETEPIARPELVSRRVLGRGGVQFLILQLAALLMSSGDNMIAAQVLGPAAVAAFAVSQRLFLLPSTIPVMWLQQLWPAYTEGTGP